MLVRLGRNRCPARCWWSCFPELPHWKKLGSFYQNYKYTYSGFSLLASGIHPSEALTHVCKDRCTRLFTAATGKDTRERLDTTDLKWIQEGNKEEFMTKLQIMFYKLKTEVVGLGM
jgi:hypothetical protein